MISYRVALACLTASVFFTGCSKADHTAAKNSSPAPALIKGVLLETVKTAAMPASFEAVGTVRAITSAILSARIPGTISVLSVREGDLVKKGQVLARLDAQENQAQAAAAAFGFDEAKRSLDEAAVRRTLADTTFERYSRLFAEQAITRQELDIKQTERDLAVQGVARAEARLKQAQEGSRAAAAIADHIRIIAPFSGVVTARQAELGATVFPGQPLMTIEDAGSYQLELALPETMVAKVRQGTTVQVTLDALNTTFNARVAEIVPSTDPASRTFTVKVNLAQHGLKSGMFGRGSIQLDTTVSGMLVTKKALVERGALTSLWVVDKDRLARLRLVKAGKSFGDKIEILAGLSDGEQVIAGGLEKVTEGSKVE